jgi:hypothetical protein
MTLELDLIDHLRACAVPGTARGANRFVVQAEGNEFAIEYSQGSSSTITFYAEYNRIARCQAVGDAPSNYRSGGGLTAARPMSIELRSENATDVGAKAKAIALEFQTGDATFDAAIYVDTPETDGTVLSAILNEAVRAQALRLFALGVDKLEIDRGHDGRVCFVLSGFGSMRTAGERAVQLVHAFATLLNALPIVAATATRTPAKRVGPMLMVVAGLFTCLPFLQLMVGPQFYGMCINTPTDDGETASSLKDGSIAAFFAAIGAGLACSLLFAFAGFAALRVALRNYPVDSDSHRRRGYYTAATILIALSLGFTLGHWLSLHLGVGM